MRIAFARKHGNRPFEWGTLAERTYPLFMLGRWDEVLEVREEFTQDQIDSMKTAGSYLGWRTAITADGDWQFFVAGD